MITIEKATKNDFKEINELLASENLPAVDIQENTDYFFKSQNETHEIVGAIGLEVYGKYGLLRSMVVVQNYRNKGIAKDLVSKIEALSRQLNLKELWLLTSTADEYFVKKGFTKVHRNETQEEIKQSKEFSSICPVSAIIMKKATE